MSITTTTNRVQYDGDDATKTFTFAFRVYANTDIVVYSTTSSVDTLQVLTTDYTVTINATTSNAGGSIVFGTAPATGATITIYRDLTHTQGTVFTVGGPLPAASLEQGLDKLTLMVQDLSERVDRRTPDYDVTASGTGGY